MGVLFMDNVSNLSLFQPEVRLNRTFFPDRAFRDALCRLFGKQMGEALSPEELSRTTQLDLSGLDIQSLKGIENFSALRELLCGSNRLSRLDVSGLPMLRVLVCEYNHLGRLDVRGCSALEVLDCRANFLSTLDLSGNPALQELLCDYNLLTRLDLQANPALVQVWCDYNRLRRLDVRANTRLQDLRNQRMGELCHA